MVKDDQPNKSAPPFEEMSDHESLPLLAEDEEEKDYSLSLSKSIYQQYFTLFQHVFFVSVASICFAEQSAFKLVSPSSNNVYRESQSMHTTRDKMEIAAVHLPKQGRKTQL